MKRRKKKMRWRRRSEGDKKVLGKLSRKRGRNAKERSMTKRKRSQQAV